MPVDFSVIIPTFRRPDTLIGTISSVLQQRHASVEILVVDDSPEGSAEGPVGRFANPRVKYLKNPEPTGGYPSVVRNIGWPLATGKFVHFLDDDDLVMEGFYGAAGNALASHPSVGMVFGRIEPFGNGPADQLEDERRYFDDAAKKAAVSGRFGSRLAFAGRMLFDKALLVCSASVIRRECLTKLGGFDPSIRLKEDADYHVRAMRECGVLFINSMAIRYRIGSPSLMHSPNKTEQQKQAERLGHRQMQTKYRNRYGALEFYGVALLTRTLLKVV
jgi:GT2 family glycosyltransferase